MTATAPLAPNNGSQPARVSIVVPAYNAAQTLERTLQSLRDQSEAAWEAIVVDDGSGDETLGLARRIAAADARIRVLSQANGGVSRARNAGLAAARGDWVLFLDSDDYLHRHALRRLLGAAEHNPQAKVVCGVGVRVDGEGRNWPFPKFDLSNAFGVLSGECALVIHSAIVQREVVEAVGGFDEGLKSAEDWDLWQRVARTGAQFRQIDDVVAYYQSQPGSLSKRIGELARNTLTVMQRGHEPDPRVPHPHPDFAQGAAPDSLGYLQLNFILWSASRDIASGGEGVWLLELLSPKTIAETDLEPDHVGSMLAQGMADVLSLQPAALAPRWGEFGPKLARLLGAVYAGEARSRQRDLALAAIMHHLAVPFETADPALTPDLLLAAHELGEPLAPVPASARPVLALQLRRNGFPVGLVISPLQGALSAPELAALVTRQFPYMPMTTAAPALRPWTSPRFWAAAAASALNPRRLASLAAAGGDKGRLKVLARDYGRHAFIDGASAVVKAGLKARLPARGAAQSVAGTDTGKGAPATRLPILMYHRVAETGSPGLARWRVTPSQFRAHMQLLKSHGFHTVDPATWASALAAHVPLKGRPILITFDDAYVDFAEHAWPILKELDLGATLFAIPGKMGGVADWDADKGEPAPLMDWASLRNLAAEGCIIGSHSFSHRPMATISLKDVRAEALRSREALAEALGQAPMSFCYPYGSHDRAVEQAVYEAGYALGFTCMHGASDLADDPMRLPRIEVTGLDDAASLARKLGLG